MKNRLLQVEHFILCVYLSRLRPWIRFTCDLEIVSAVMHSILRDAGVDGEPTVVPDPGRPGGYLTYGLLNKPCLCGDPQFPHRHTFECDKHRLGLEMAWDSLRCAKFGCSAPFVTPNHWMAAHQAQHSLEILGYTECEAMGMLGLELDLVALEPMRKSINDRYNLDQHRRWYEEHPNDFAIALESAMAWRSTGQPMVEPYASMYTLAVAAM